MKPFDDPMRSYFTGIAGALSRAKGGETKSLAAASMPQPAQSLEIPSIDYQPDFHTPPSRNPALEEYARMHRDLYKLDFAPFNQPLVLIFEELTEAEKRRQNPAYAAERKKTHDRHVNGTYDRQGVGKFVLKVDEETKAKIKAVLELINLSKFPDSLYPNLFYDKLSGGKTLEATPHTAFPQATMPTHPPAAKPAEPVFDFDAGRAAVNQFSGGTRVPKLDPSNKP